MIDVGRFKIGLSFNFSHGLYIVNSSCVVYTMYILSLISQDIPFLIYRVLTSFYRSSSSNKWELLSPSPGPPPSISPSLSLQNRGRTAFLFFFFFFFPQSAPPPGKAFFSNSQFPIFHHLPHTHTHNLSRLPTNSTNTTYC